MKNPLTPAGIEPTTFRFVAQYLNHCATAVPNRNEYQEYFPGVKGGRCVGLTTLPPSCADYLEIWGLNLLEPSGPVQACNRIALPFKILAQLLSHSKTLCPHYKNQLVNDVKGNVHCERRYTKVINALCGGTGKVLLMLKCVVHMVTTTLQMLNNVIKNE